MQIPTTTDPRGAGCADAPPSPPGVRELVGQPLFPPQDADADARRRWLASSPWPEVVFAAAGA